MTYVRKEVIGNATLYLGDCLEIMGEMEDGSVNMVITSPPYDKLRTYENSLLWNEDIWKLIIQKLHNIITNGGVVVWVVGDAVLFGGETGTSFQQALYFRDLGFNIHDTMIYCKSDTPPHLARRYEQAFEFMFVFSKGKLNVFNGIQDRKNVGFGRLITGTSRKSDGKTYRSHGAEKRKTVSKFALRTNVWVFDTAKGRKQYDHPAQFPKRLAEDHIKSWSNKNQTIFDPLMGSGTTGVACAELGRRFVGIEIVPKYFDMACERIAKASGDFGMYKEKKKRGFLY